MSQKPNGRQTEEIDLVELEEQQVFAKCAERLEHLRFGPCDITPQAWKSIRLTVKAHSSQPAGKEVPLALLGRLVGTRFLIENTVQIMTQEADPSHCIYDIEDIRKIEKEAEKNKQMLLGTAHSHTESKPMQPSHRDRITWLFLMFEFDRPLFYYIISADALQVGAYSISIDSFLLLKEAVKFLSVEVDKNE